MRIYLCALLLALIILPLKSQNIDSLTQALNHSSGSERIDVLFQLAEAYMYQDWEMSLQYAREVENLVGNEKNTPWAFEAAYVLSKALEGLGNYDEALTYAKEAVELAQNDADKADIFHHLGHTYESLSEFQSALDYHLKAIALRKKSGDLKKLANAYNSLAFVYKGMSLYDRAIVTLEESLSISQELGDASGVSKATFNIGLMTMEMNKHAEAIPYFKEAMVGLNEEDFPHQFSYYYNNMANCFEKQLHINAAFYDSALIYGKKSLVIKMRLNNLRGIANSHNTLAATYERASDYKNSFYHATEALRLSDSLDFKPIKRNALSYLITAELGLGKTESTNDHFEEYIDVVEEINEASYSRTLSDMAFKYETEKKEAENLLLRTEAEQQKLINLLLLSLAVVLVAGLVLLIYFFRLKQRTNEKLSTDKKLIEEQARRLTELNDLKSQFFANVSHELRTPLTLIQGHAEDAMSIKKLPAQASEPLKKIKRNVHQLAVMVNDLLDLSKIELKQKLVTVKPVDVDGLLKRICGAFSSLAESRQIGLSYTSNQHEVTAAMLDENQFEKVINNLIYNAFKFTPQGGTVKVTMSRVLEGIEVLVTDNGTGIRPEEVPYIFDRFYQAKDQMSTSFGSGMGLAISKELIDMMGGELSVTSELGKGSTFRMILQPTDETPEALVGDSYQLEAVTPADLRMDTLEIPSDTSVMIVEDNPDIRSYLGTILRDHFQLIMAEHGQDALDQLERESPDLILTDVMMPVMNGWEFIEALQGKPSKAKIPVIVLTAVAENQERIKGLRMGVDDYILKPFEAEELLIRISNVVKNLR
ncbi:MAG: response regulator, partial [Marinoscillum sp.]